ncbi:MAG: M23 family metallopeptidase [Peptococcia bacterium]
MQLRKTRRDRREALREKQLRSLKNLGIYLAVVLLIFAILIPLIGQRLQQLRSNEAQRVLTTAEENTAPEGMLGETLQGGAVQAEVTPVEDLSPQKAVLDQKEKISAEPTSSLSTIDSINEAVLKSEKANNANNPDSVINNDKIEKTSSSEQASEPIAKPRSSQQPAADLSQIIRPLDGELIKVFGLAYSATHGDYRFHDGIDIKASIGSIVKAALPGKVIKSETTKDQATVVILDHGDGWLSSYAHLGKSSVRVGQTLKAGQTIGTVGEPGLSEVSDEPHLHFTLTQDGKAVDPLEYLPNK